jgi:predicted type IV restriction endonuclease
MRLKLRREFIDPFFKALGWDVDNEQGYAKTDDEICILEEEMMGRHDKGRRTPAEGDS